MSCSGRRSRPSTTGAIAAITTHRAELAAADRTTHRGIPVTSPARTLADLAHVLDHDELTRALREAMFRRLYDPEAIQDALTRRPSKALKDLLTEASVTQSMMEDRFLTICKRHQLRAPHAAPHRRQALRLRLAAAQGRRRDRLLARRTPTRYAFQADRSQTNALQLAGWLVLRFTWADLTRRSRATAATVGQALTR